MDCRYCPAPTHVHPHSVTCGASACKKEHQRDRCRDQQRSYRAAARNRGECYSDRWRSEERKQAAFQRLAELAAAEPGRYRKAKQESWHRRRARKKAATVEVFRHEDVFVRDGWTCGLCGNPVDPALRHPHPMSASLDHVVPISLGGAHSTANTQCSHLDCNVRKHARIDWKPEVVA